MIRGWIEEAHAAGARHRRCCQLLGLSPRTLERWRAGEADDARRGPRPAPRNTLTETEHAVLLETVNAAPYRNLSPNQIVPHLADAGVYLGSEATIYRLLRRERLLAHRGRAKAPTPRGPRAHVATGPNQVWSWDITYLPTPIRGVFSYLYLIMDVWSRMIVGWQVSDVEAAARAAALFVATCRRQHVDPRGVVLHADNGGPMKGATMVATLERLGVLASFSRPGVSNDNPFSESLFRTLKYRPEYPNAPFADVVAAQDWVRGFVRWYNTQHLHSAIRFVTPADRHAGREMAILAQRQAVYAQARAARPDRWSGPSRNWTPIAEVHLNPDHARIDATEGTAA